MHVNCNKLHNYLPNLPNLNNSPINKFLGASHCSPIYIEYQINLHVKDPFCSGHFTTVLIPHNVQFVIANITEVKLVFI